MITASLRKYHAKIKRRRRRRIRGRGRRTRQRRKLNLNNLLWIKTFYSACARAWWCGCFFSFREEADLEDTRRTVLVYRAAVSPIYILYVSIMHARTPSSCQPRSIFKKKKLPPAGAGATTIVLFQFLSRIDIKYG